MAIEFGMSFKIINDAARIIRFELNTALNVLYFVALSRGQGCDGRRAHDDAAVKLAWRASHRDGRLKSGCTG